ncbi:MAG TPA: alpha-E domain-containing protein [Dinghuibacter sp.]|uniref:alpha-E domain-containing protein n=1 Tax=Dinghuibacter sp. TaxID=2024697 RepID=UPI002C4A3777|nr:alpha-E domain-containing protein [Dinghuibacter sp.]HTJ13036.1 alpha-E domain-containing protein [Dinghuibacter sp.]
MLSRIADALFWLNRYMERADGLLRVAATHYTLSMDKDVNGTMTWQPMLELFTRATPQEAATLGNDTEAVLKKILTDTTNTNSLRVIVSRARENARGVQDHITKEVWEAVNSIYHLAEGRGFEDQLSSYGALNVMEQFSRHCVLYTGITDITMPRGVGWSFMNLGKYLERSLEALALTNKQFELIQYDLSDTRDIVQWRYLLLSLSGYELYLKTYRSPHYTLNVLHQVLFNEHFPHSLLYSLTRLERHLRNVVKENRSADSEALVRHFGRIHARVRYMDLENINGRTLQEFFAELRQDLLQFSKRLSQHFFSYS